MKRIRSYGTQEKSGIRASLLNTFLMFLLYFLFLKLFTDESLFKLLSASLDTYHFPEFNWKFYR